MGQVVQFPVKAQAALTKRQLARALGYSTRWVEMRTAEGMPAHRAPNGERRYVLADVLKWFENRAHEIRHEMLEHTR